MKYSGFGEGEEDLSEVRRVLFSFCFLCIVLAGALMVCLHCSGCGKQEVILYGEAADGAEDPGYKQSTDDLSRADGTETAKRFGSEDSADREEIVGSTGNPDNAGGNEMTGNKDQSDNADKAGNTDAAGDKGGADDKEEYAADSVIFVQICGAVEKPGVYAAPDGTRIYEFVEMAGGLSEDAAPDAVNQAQAAVDGDMVRIPTREQWEEEKSGYGLIRGQQTGDGIAESTDGNGGSGSGNGTTGDKVNINTADEAALCTLPGIGEAKAAAIIEYRDAHGSFQSVQDICNVAGIGEKLYQKIRERITV